MNKNSTPSAAAIDAMALATPTEPRSFPFPGHSLHDGDMGIWFRQPQMERGESVRWKKAARWLQDPSHQVAGRLYLTGTRLLFEPTRAHAKGWHWYTLLHQIASVGIEGSHIMPQPAGLPSRLRINLTEGRAEFFVVDHLEKVVKVIGTAIPNPRE